MFRVLDSKLLSLNLTIDITLSDNSKRQKLAIPLHDGSIVLSWRHKVVGGLLVLFASHVTVDDPSSSKVTIHDKLHTDPQT